MDTNQKHAEHDKEKNTKGMVCGVYQHKIAGFKGDCMMGCGIQPGHNPMHRYGPDSGGTRGPE